jgi:hypothetical protein
MIVLNIVDGIQQASAGRRDLFTGWGAVTARQVGIKNVLCGRYGY